MEETQERARGPVAGSRDIAIEFNIENIKFWETQMWTGLPLLGRIARIAFTVRTSEAAAERSFSHASMRLTPQRNQLKIDNLSNEVFCRINSKLTTRHVHFRRGRKKWRVPAASTQSTTNINRSTQSTNCTGTYS